MKKLILSLTLLIAAVAGASALEHTVQRGETLESVAKAYNITTQQLVNANPGADKLFYVGLKLNIPEADAAATPAANPSSPTLPIADTEIPSETTPTDMPEESSGPGASIIFEYSMGFPQKVEGLKHQTHLDFAISVGAAYWFMNKMDGFFASAAIGYDGDTYSCPKPQTSYDFHMINVPVKAGYAITGANKNFAIIPYLGFDLALTIAAKAKINDEKYNVDTGKFIPTFRVGAIIRVGDVDLGAYFRVPMGDEAKGVFGSKGHFGFTVGYGF